MNPKFSASHMKFIMEQEMAGKDVTWLPIGKILHRSIVDKPLTRDQIRRIKERMQRAESKDSVIADLHEKKKEAARVPKKQGQPDCNLPQLHNNPYPASCCRSADGSYPVPGMV